jgi:transcriptional regulator with XRE-family HTH domain
VPARLPVKFVFDPTLLRAARKVRGLTQQQVADEVPCSKPLVALTEIGYKRPAPETLAAMADVVGCSLDDLFVEVDDDERETAAN